MKINSQSRLVVASFPKEFSEVNSTKLREFANRAKTYGIDVNTAKFIPIEEAKEARRFLKKSGGYGMVIGLNKATKLYPRAFISYAFIADPEFAYETVVYSDEYKNIKQLAEGADYLYVVEGNEETKKRLDELIEKRKNSKAPDELQRGTPYKRTLMYDYDASGYPVDRQKYDANLFIKRYARVNALARKVIPLFRQYLKYTCDKYINLYVRTGVFNVNVSSKLPDYLYRETRDAIDGAFNQGFSLNLLLDCSAVISDMKYKYKSDHEFLAAAKMSDQDVKAFVNRLTQFINEAKRYSDIYTLI